LSPLDAASVRFDRDNIVPWGDTVCRSAGAFVCGFFFLLGSPVHDAKNLRETTLSWITRRRDSIGQRQDGECRRTINLIIFCYLIKLLDTPYLLEMREEPACPLDIEYGQFIRVDSTCLRWNVARYPQNTNTYGTTEYHTVVFGLSLTVTNYARFLPRRSILSLCRYSVQYKSCEIVQKPCTVFRRDFNPRSKFKPPPGAAQTTDGGF